MGNTKEKKRINKQLLIIMVAVFVALSVVAALTIRSYRNSFKKFVADGYILNPSKDKDSTDDANVQYYFSEGTKYREKYGQNIVFKDTSNNKVSIDTEQFIHYSEGSLASFSKGVVMNLEEVNNNQVTYYGVSKKTSLVRNGQLYEMKYLGNELQLQEFIWKISDKTYMLVAPQVTFYMGDNTTVVFPDYVQVQYVDGGIVRLVHQQGTYQTISSEAYLLTDGGIELELIDRTFFVDGKGTVTLDDMVIDSSSNLQVDEEEKIKIPTFNVINGTDGASGNSGETGAAGEDGNSGEDGDDGDKGNQGNGGDNGTGGTGGAAGTGGNGGGDGFDGGDGYDGYTGEKGDDGDEGETGEIGYDGKPGDDGADAENAGNPDGIASVELPKAPRISLETDTYEVTANSVSMNLKIDDEEGMISSDITVVITERDSNKTVYSTTIARGANSAVIETSALSPDKDYVIICSADYMYEGLEYAGVNLFAKIFRTDTVGISIEKLQIKEDSIEVKTVITDDSNVLSYGFAVYDMDGNQISEHATTYTAASTFVIKKDSILKSGLELKPDTEYVVMLTNIVSKAHSVISAKVSETYRTLKETPYYEKNGVNTAVGEVLATAVGSERYKTVTVSIDTAIKDNNSGIKGYRYELYEVASLGSNPTTAPSDSKTVDSLQSVAFNVDAGKNYVARVVVLFNDNEKLVEIPSGYSKTVSIGEVIYPTVGFENVTINYDAIAGYIKIKDDYGMLLDHINEDYPLVVSLISEAGDTIKVNLTEETTPAGVTGGDENLKYYAFSVDNLRRNTKYTVSVAGAVNTMISDKPWEALTDEEKESCKSYYLAGMNIDTGSPAVFAAIWDNDTSLDSSIFKVKFGIKAAAADAQYEAGNLEKVSFKLINVTTGQQIGQEAILTDNNTLKHESDFTGAYNEGDDTLNYTYFERTLTDASFGVSGDSRLAGGGKFAIIVTSSYDYTERTSSEYTNKMEFDENTITYEFELETKHTQLADPNKAISVNQIENQHSIQVYHRDDLDNDIVVGLNIRPDYQWSDAIRIRYYVYDVSNLSTALPIYENTYISENIIEAAGVTLQPKAVRTIELSTTGAGISNPWTVYFDDVDPTSQFNNLVDVEDVSLGTIFERGKQYFIRYEVDCNGSMNNETRYPDCVYPGNVKDILFYRSQTFSMDKQVPTIGRYMWDSLASTASGISSEWKYRIVDPDNAIGSYAESKGQGVLATVYSNKEYAKLYDFTLGDNATAVNKNTLTKATVSMDSMYDEGNADNSGYYILKTPEITKNYYYEVEIPYLICDLQIEDKVAFNNSNVVQMKAANTFATSTINETTYNLSEIKVNGVVVKGTAINNEATSNGIVDEGGYRIKLTLQGNEDLYKIAALKVTITDGVKTVYYDPVSLRFNNGTTGSGSNVNYYANAFLDYEKLAEAGLTRAQVTMSIEAYYLTGRTGVKSFINRSYVNSGDQFTDRYAWAVKGTTYDSEIYTESFWRYDEDGRLIASPTVQQIKNGLYTTVYTAGGSILLPSYGAENANNGLGIEGFLGTMRFVNAYGTPNIKLILEADNTDFYSSSVDNYIELSELKLSNKLQIALNIATDNAQYSDYKNSNYTKAPFFTGDGMIGIKYDRNASTVGMSSVNMFFDVSGTSPADDKTVYIKLYDSLGTEIPITKCVDDNGTYYKVTSALEVEDVEAGNNLGCEIVGNRINYAIRGLDDDTAYYIDVWGVNLGGEKQLLFDYDQEMTGCKYSFTTNKNIIIDAAYTGYIYNSYSDKYMYGNFIVEGSEGMYMRIFYQIFDENDQEITFGNNINMGGINYSYVDGKGYVITPLGNSIKYYSSVQGTNNIVLVPFVPGGQIKVDKTYSVKLTAYSAKNNGVITNNKSIGTQTFTFTTPKQFTTPYVSMRVVPGESSITVTSTITSVMKSIYDDEYTVELVSEDGTDVMAVSTINVAGKYTKNSVKTEVVFVKTGTGAVGEVVCPELNTNTTYIVRVRAKYDSTNNKNNSSMTYYKKEITTATVSSASAAVVTSFNASGQLVFTLRDLANFDAVTKIIYTIDSDNGNTNYANGVGTIGSEWIGNGTTATIYTGNTNWRPSSTGNSYMYTLQYYDDTDKLIGSSSGYFNN